MVHRLPWRLWLGALAVWTTLLVVPGDWFYEDAAKIKITGDIGLGKLLHVMAYGTLAGSAGWLRLPLRRRLLVALSLVGHGVLTEFIQTFVRYREGCMRDVLIDAASISIGLAVTWRWWPRGDSGDNTAK